MRPRRGMSGWPRITRNVASHQGVWVGSGMDGIDGVDAGDPVTAEQMRNLFGHGMHPLADVRAQHFEVSDIMLDAVDDAMWLGAPFRVVDEATPFRVEVAKRIADLNALIGAPADAEVAASSRARIRTELAKEFFYAEHGCDPVDARELAAQIAKDSRPRSQPVAGYDLTFSPVKSVSTLWAGHPDRGGGEDHLAAEALSFRLGEDRHVSGPVSRRDDQHLRGVADFEAVGAEPAAGLPAVPAPGVAVEAV